jgi:putative hydrolase of the HAD superfamily
MIKNVIFDLYGTLVDIHTDEEDTKFWEKYALYFSYFLGEIEAVDLKANYHKYVNEAVDQVEGTPYPDVDLLKVFDRLFEHYGYDADEALREEAARVFRLLSTDYVTLYPHAMDLMEKLKSLGIKAYLLTNAQRCFTLHELKRLKLDHMFEGIYISSDYEMAKPERMFLEILVEEEEIDLKESIFVGNDPRTDVAIAQTVGMRSIYLQTNCSPAYADDISATYVINPGDLKQVENLIEREYHKEA